MTDPNDVRLRFARKLGTSSVIVRAIGIMVMVGSVIGVLVSLSLRRSSDRVGFTLISMAVLVLGALVWGSGVFHAAVSRFLPSVLDIEDKLDALSRPKKARRAAPVEAAAPSQTLDVSAAAEAPALAETVPPEASPRRAARSASATSTIPEPWVAGAAGTKHSAPGNVTADEAQADAEANSTTGDSNSPEAEAKLEPEPQHRAREEEPPPQRVPCPHCGGGIHPEASRCVHCMRRVERHAPLAS